MGGKIDAPDPSVKTLDQRQIIDCLHLHITIKVDTRRPSGRLMATG
jgi:hypothetical protein